MFEAYKVAVRLSLVSDVGMGLTALSGQFARLNKDVDSAQHSINGLQRSMLELKRMGMVGGAMAAAGGLGLGMLRGPLDEAKKFQIESAKFSSLGFGETINKQAEQFAIGMKTMGVSARENMGIVGDAMAVFKDLGEAQMAAPLIAKMKFANEVIFGADGGERDKKLMDMMKVAEFRGGTKSPEEFARQVNFAQQAIAGSRNRVDASAMLQALKTGGVALSSRSNEAFYLGAEPLIQEFGGSRYGTAAMSIYQNLVQARGTITAQQELYRLGLLDKSMVQFNNLGMLKKALPGAFKGSAILENEGELALLEKVLLPAFAAKGITSEEGIIRELGMILGNRTGSSLMSRIYQQREKLHMQTDANLHAENLDQANKRAMGMYQGKLIDLDKKWADVMRDLGTAILPIAIEAVEDFTGVLKGISWFAEEFPAMTKWLTIGFGVLAGIVAAGGVLMLATAGFKALGLALGTGGAAGVGGSLMSVSKGLGAVAAAAAVWQASTYLGDKWYENMDDAHRDQAGRNVAWLLALFGSKEAQDAIDQMDKNVKPGGSTPINVHVHNKVDERGITSTVTRMMERIANRPTSGTSSFDGSMSPRPVGAGG